MVLLHLSDKQKEKISLLNTFDETSIFRKNILFLEALFFKLNFNCFFVFVIYKLLENSVVFQLNQ